METSPPVGEIDSNWLNAPKSVRCYSYPIAESIWRIQTGEFKGFSSVQLRRVLRRSSGNDGIGYACGSPGTVVSSSLGIPRFSSPFSRTMPPSSGRRFSESLRSKFIIHHSPFDILGTDEAEPLPGRSDDGTSPGLTPWAGQQRASADPLVATGDELVKKWRTVLPSLIYLKPFGRRGGPPGWPAPAGLAGERRTVPRRAAAVRGQRGLLVG